MRKEGTITYFKNRDLSGLTQTLPIECPPAPQIGCVPSPASDTYSPLLVGEMSPGRPNLVSRFSDDTTVYGGSSRDSLADPSRATSPVDVQSPRIVVDPSEPPDSSSAGPSTSASNNFSPAKPIYSKGKRPPRLNLTVSSYETVGQSKPATPGTISALESVSSSFTICAQEISDTFMFCQLGLLTDEKLPTRSPRPYIY